MSDEYRSRNLDQEAHERHVRGLLDQLAELERETDPAGGAATAIRKDLRAFHALRTVGLLADALAGWALDHVYGSARSGFEFVPQQPDGHAEKLEEYREKLALVDDHRHERDGTLAAEAYQVDPLALRRALRYLNQAEAIGLPHAGRTMLDEALRALDFGEVLPVFQPASGRRKRQFRELRCMLDAVCFVEHRYAAGARKSVALEEVGRAYSASPETVNSWGKRLREPEGLGEMEVVRAIDFARNSAFNLKAAEAKLSLLRGRPRPILRAERERVDEEERAARATIKFIESEYG